MPQTESTTIPDGATLDARLMADISETNLSYLILAQSLIRHDRAVALFRLGISEEVATLIEGLSPAQLMKIAQGNRVMCRLRFDDEIMWSLLADRTLAGEAAATARDERVAAGSERSAVTVAASAAARTVPVDAHAAQRTAPMLHASILMASRHEEAIDGHA